MNPIVKNVTLPTGTSSSPSVGLHLMAKNAESVVGRLLDCVLPHVSGLSLVLNDTTDATLKVVTSKIGSKWFSFHEVTHHSHPQFYFPDVAATYQEGHSLAGETFDGPFTNGPLLCDWAGARNVGWDAMGGLCDYQLFLDADDVVEDPQSIPALATLMSANSVDVAATRYTFGRGPGGQANSLSYRERLARNTPLIRWEGATHETLRGGLRRVLVEDVLRVTDMKDNWGRGVRVPGRCFKVLYRQARLADWQVTPRHLAYLVQECPGMMPVSWVSDHLLPKYLAESTELEEEAWVLCVAGEMWEAKREHERASSCYRSSVERFPTPKGYFRLCRARFGAGDWQGAAEAYEVGAKVAGKNVVLDDGPVYADSTKILAAQAYHGMGDYVRAAELAREAALAFPRSRTVASLRDRICGGGT